MANILVNCVSAGSGGALTYLQNLVPKLIKMFENDVNHNVCLLIKNDQRKLIDDCLEDYVIYAPNLGGYKRFIWEYMNLPKIINHRNIDLVFTPYQIARVFKNIKNIVMFRNMEPFTFHKYKNSFGNWLRNHILKIKTINTIKNADKVVAVSDYVKEVILLNKITNEDAIARIYHGRNTRFNPEISETDKTTLDKLGIADKYIFTCGSLFPYRKTEDVIKAYQKASKPHVKLVIAGSGNDNQYKKLLNDLITQCGVSDSVLMLGHVSLDEMIVLYRNCSLFVTSTETEACPNIAIEAMSSGCSILSSDVMPLPEIFQDAAVYYPHGDQVQLASMMADMVSEDKTVNSRALSTIDSFSWETCAKQTYELIINEL